MGVRQTGLNQAYESRATRKSIETMSDLCHILSQYCNNATIRPKDFRATEANIFNSLIPM